MTDLVQIHETERNDLVKRSVKQRKKMDKTQGEIEHYLDDVVIALNQRHVALEIENKTEYAIVKEDVRNKVLQYGSTGCGVFKFTKLEILLSKNHHTKMKLLNFENWTNGEVSKIELHFSN